jgi:hypothetical protein
MMMKQDNFGVIYKITNNLNGKVYVGQTTIKLGLRWNLHCTAKSNKGKLQDDIKNLGRKNFSLEIIDTAVSREDLNSKEHMHILANKSIESGYNIRNGGRNGKMHPDSVRKMTQSIKDFCAHKKMPIALLDADFNVIRKFDSIKEAEKSMNIKVTAYLKLKKVSFHGGYWVYCSNFENGIAAIKEKIAGDYTPKYKRVIQLSLLDGSVIREFSTMTEAANSVGAHKANISAVCHGKKPTCKGFSWKIKE